MYKIEVYYYIATYKDIIMKLSFIIIIYNIEIRN